MGRWACRLFAPYYPERKGFATCWAEEALQPLIDDGRADEIIVTYTQPHNGLLILDISIRDNRGETYQFKHPVKVI